MDISSRTLALTNRNNWIITFPLMCIFKTNPTCSFDASGPCQLFDCIKFSGLAHKILGLLKWILLKHVFGVAFLNRILYYILLLFPGLGIQFENVIIDLLQGYVFVSFSIVRPVFNHNRHSTDSDYITTTNNKSIFSFRLCSFATRWKIGACFKFKYFIVSDNKFSFSWQILK